jgi:deoxyribodipyrimidine photo-lyase
LARRGLHWFRNDLRLSDNTALWEAASCSDALELLFVLDDRLLGSPSMGAARIRFLCESLTALAALAESRGQRLRIRRGDPREVVPQEVRRAKVDLLTFNRDTTPWARTRDRAVCEALGGLGIEIRSSTDRVVFAGDAVRTQAGRPYTVFSPYRKAWLERYAKHRPTARRAPRLPPPIDETTRPDSVPDPQTLGFEVCRADLPANGGEEAGRRRLGYFLDHVVGRYAEDRDRPAVDGTSRLSPHLHFGTISIRQCLDAAREAAADDPRRRKGIDKWVDELIWREFYAQVLEHHPRAARRSFRTEYDAIEWEDRDDRFEAWCAGETGFPIVDAGMRQLRETGWMHNRLRMIVASFLTKDLLIDWRRGEAHFSRLLVDADAASNNGGWQWAASTGTDAQPWFRIFNPTRQSERFDPEGDYVRRFVPELAGLDGATIHRPEVSPLLAPGYPAPIVSHADQRAEALRRYERARKGGARGC